MLYTLCHLNENLAKNIVITAAFLRRDRHSSLTTNVQSPDVLFNQDVSKRLVGVTFVVVVGKFLNILHHLCVTTPQIAIR